MVRPAGAFTAEVRVPTTGWFGALVVFVRFRDDTAVWSGSLGCTPASQAWAHPDAALPDFAWNLLASSPTPPFPEYSLTDYFYQQSQGRFTLYCDVYPRVVVTDKDEAGYRRGPRSAVLKQATLTKEILDRIDADRTFDLGRYDANDDGFIDHVD